MSPGTPAAPYVTDDLGQCVDWAKRGWIFAMSSYRDESISIASDNPTLFSGGPWHSSSTKADGSSEFCMGEVTDVMALVDLLVNHIKTIGIGNPNNPAEQIYIATSYNPRRRPPAPAAWNGEVFMYGYSHGGCITYRAVEQGAPVNAFAVIEGFTDFSLNYLNGWTACNSNHSLCMVPGPGGTMVFYPTGVAAAGSGAVDTTGHIPYFPDTSGVMGYNWRSAHYFASLGDLSIQKFKTMPILILHGDIDTANPVPLDEPTEFAPDIINATEIFYGPNGTAPANEPCIKPPPPVGAPIVLLF
jgi:hypothetical protein